MKLLNFDEVVDKMIQMKKDGLSPEIFTNRGWGDQPLEIHLIEDGDGQTPLAEINIETFKRLKTEGIITGNKLLTYKARTLHFFNGV